MITRELLVDEALALLDERGEAGLSMRALAARVDRRVSSLYHHVSGREELVELIRARVVEEIEYAHFEHHPWREALRRWACSYLEAFAAHRTALTLLATAPIRDISTYRMYEVVVQALVRGGWDSTRAVTVMRSVESFVMGSVLDHGAPEDFLTTEALGEDQESLAAALGGGAPSSYSAHAAFELGLDALIRGLDPSGPALRQPGPAVGE